MAVCQVFVPLVSGTRGTPGGVASSVSALSQRGGEVSQNEELMACGETRGPPCRGALLADSRFCLMGLSLGNTMLAQHRKGHAEGWVPTPSAPRLEQTSGCQRPRGKQTP